MNLNAPKFSPTEEVGVLEVGRIFVHHQRQRTCSRVRVL